MYEKKEAIETNERHTERMVMKNYKKKDQGFFYGLNNVRS
jgi:hypothetical protein